MQACLDLAVLGEYFATPNPMVGCVIVYKGNIVASGYHENFGGPHAEVNAFSNLSNEINPSFCEVYVNLEPCSHYGKTPPCADLLIAKKPKRIIIGMLDPNKKVAGTGIRKLMEAGITVKIGVLENECLALNKKFICSHTLQRPFVTLKWAETSDGYMARDVSDSRNTAKISDTKNDTLVHKLRATHQAILVGAQTVNRDNPMLNVRGLEGNDPIKIIISGTLSVNINAKLFESGSVLVYNNKLAKKENNVEWIVSDRNNLLNILIDIHAKNIQSVLVEGGASVLRQFIEQKLWDEAIILKSKTIWNQGAKAPWIGIQSYKEELSNSDTIKYFVP